MEQWSHCILNAVSGHGTESLPATRHRGLEKASANAFDIYAVSPATVLHHCGVGMRTQIIACRDEHGNNHTADICGQPGKEPRGTEGPKLRLKENFGKKKYVCLLDTDKGYLIKK